MSTIFVDNIKTVSGTDTFKDGQFGGTVNSSATLSSGLTFAGTTTGTHSGASTGAHSGSISSSATFPAGTILQSTQVYTSSYLSAGLMGGSGDRYFVNGAKTVMSNTTRHGTGTDVISTSNDYVHTLTAKQSNSIYRMHLTMPVYITTSTHGHFCTVYAQMQYSTSPTSGYTTLRESNDDGNEGIIYWYQDNRSTYGTSGQDLHRVSGFDDFYSSYSAGTTIYFNVIVYYSRASTERFFKCYVEEIAT